MASLGIPRANALVELFLDQEVKIRRTWRDHQLLRVRENASKREIDIIYRKMFVHLRPDKHHFQDWVIKNSPDTPQETMEECKTIMRDFWAKWQETKVARWLSLLEQSLGLGQTCQSRGPGSQGRPTNDGREDHDICAPQP